MKTILAILLLSIVSAFGAGNVNLTWVASTTTLVTKYHIFEKGNPAKLATVDAPLVTYKLLNVSSGEHTYYVVAALADDTQSLPSNEALLPAAPTGLKATLELVGTITINVP